MIIRKPFSKFKIQKAFVYCILGCLWELNYWILLIYAGLAQGLAQRKLLQSEYMNVFIWPYLACLVLYNLTPEQVNITLGFLIIR